MSAPPPPLPRRERPSIPLPTPPDRHFSAPIEAQSPPFITSPAPSSSSAENNTMLPVPDLSSGEANFGSCLQSSYEAISKRHEEELHALESFRGHVFKRQRADKEYAEQLLRINQASERAAQFPHSTTSPIVQAWKVFLQISGKMQAQLSASADQMKSMIEIIDDLIKNKRGAKKVSDDQRVHLDTEFTSMCNHVQDLRRDYRKHLRSTDKCKNNLLSSQQKQAKPTEIDKNRSKFVNAARKLHHCHNDYALSIVNVNIHQEFYRRTLLPFTLDTLQERMEMQISDWRNILTRYAQCLDMAKLYEESFSLFYEAIGQVEKESEYVQLIRDNKKEQPPIERFEFDGSLLHAPCAPAGVQAGQITINNLTHKAMTDKVAKYESDIVQHEYDISQKTQKLEELQASLDESSVSSPRAESKILPRHVQIADLKGQIYELQDKLCCKQQQVGLINESLIPLQDQCSPLFDPLGESEGDAAMDESQFSGSIAVDDPYSGTKVKKGGKVKAAETIKRFKSVFARSGNKKNPSVSDDSRDEDGVHAMDGDDDDDEYEQPPEISIEEEAWYYGVMDRKDAERKCGNAGDYLVRYSDRQNKYVLTVNWNGQGRHFVIQEVPDPQNPSIALYRFEDKAFAIVRDLLDYHVQSGIPVTRNSGAVLCKFVSRIDKWTIRREDIILGRKLGRGAFGEVCEATMSNGERVAVKTCRETIPAAEKRKFLQEADILKQYDHPNIVKLIGVCAEKDPVYIIMEILPGGSFLDFLRKKGGQQTKKKLAIMVTDASAGMAYLESMNCIHRDLAARNCLVGENDIVKISDFGMSREEECGIYQVSSGSRQIPIKWTAPEALNLGRYTSHSDVWSFGVLLWETFSLGSTPYPGMSNNEAREQVELGYRLPPPSNCPDVLYNIMQMCWKYDEEDRPTFQEIHGLLQDAQTKIHN